ncbi:electron transfer flavoprotein subunit beta/FixA family protein [Bosea sp. 117]|uniref:electron transfer flavoprotein subunit beta/FixA family protein n=1 Tax=Bosea sp. 117 TaxID=1125973 RepID=UPI0004946439|nr:electron transfer flavoprotein subunit beta/FixA family protein [Bosea sp. 117]
MKILVAVKRVVDPNVKIRVKADGSGVELGGLKMAINPFDEIAVEEAVRLKEAGRAREIVAVTVGTAQAHDVLRTAMAIGVDRGLLVQAEGPLEPLAVAKVLARVIAEEAPDLVLLGKQAVDDDCNQTGQMLAALLDWPQATFASKITVVGDMVEVTREVDSGLQTLEMELPAIVTVDLRLNEPRYASLPSIMQAKRKPLQTRPVTDLGIDVAPRLRVLKTAEPAARAAGIRLNSVEELLHKLKHEAGVL